MDLRSALRRGAARPRHGLRALALIWGAWTLCIAAAAATQESEQESEEIDRWAPAADGKATMAHYLFAGCLPEFTGKAIDPRLEPLLDAYGWRDKGALKGLSNFEWYFQVLLQELAMKDDWPALASREEALIAFYTRKFAADEERGKAHDLLGKTLVNDASQFYRHGRPGRLIAALDLALQELEPGSAWYPMLLSMKAAQRRNEGNLPEAQVLLAQAREVLLTKAPRPRGAEVQARTLCSLELEDSAQHICLGLSERAYGFVQEAKRHLPVAKSVGARFDVAFAELNLATALDRSSDLRAAYEPLAKDLAWQSKLGPGSFAQLTIRYGMGLAEAARASGGTSLEAEAALVEALEADGLILEDQALALYWLAGLLLDRGKAAEALERYEELLALHVEGDRLPERTVAELHGLEARLAFAGKLPIRPALERVSRALTALGDKWRDQDVLVSGRGTARTRDRLGLLEGVVGLHAKLGQPDQALHQVARFGDAGSQARALGAGSWQARSLADLTPEDGGLLVFVPGATRSWVFVVERTGVRAFPAGNVHAFDRVRQAVERGLARSASEVGKGATGTPMLSNSDLDQALTDFREVLGWERYGAQVLGWERARLVGCASAGSPPLDLLPVDGEGRLGSQVEISYLPSLAVGQALLRRPPGEAGSFLVLDAIGPESGVELGDLLEGLPSGTGQVLPCDSAPRAASLLGTCAAAALVGHGVDSGRRDGSVSLLMDPGPPRRLLGAAELESMTACAGYVELIACGTWQGRLQRGDDGRQYLYSSLLQAGAHTLLHSSQPLIADLVVAEVAAMHAHLRSGGRPSAALRSMRREIGEAHGLHPYLVQVVGLDRALPEWQSTETVGANLEGLGAWLPWIVPGLVLLAGAYLVAARLRRRLG